ncbi:MAG: ABC transporter permease [Chitinophagaceae bacterium]
MYKLWVTIHKDIRILARDSVGIMLMFGMPIILVLIVTSIQNNTFELVNKNKISLLVCNRDTGMISSGFLKEVDKIGMFKMQTVSKLATRKMVIAKMNSEDALLAIIIPADFSLKIENKTKLEVEKALNVFGLEAGKLIPTYGKAPPISLYYQSILQESNRQSIEGALNGALQMVESRQILRNLYYSIKEKPLPSKIEDELLNNQSDIKDFPLSINGSMATPNASQHNVPAWTIFAMFFVVVSLGGSIVREKLSGSFTRLRTLPTNYILSLLSKQITYLGVTMAQAAVIFAMGVWLFPLIGLQKLNLPADISGLIIVSLICGWCAVSYAMCVGIFAKTQEQANGFGAVSIVILAAIGGLMVPSFAMPESFRIAMNLSPLHWCLEAYYGLFLQGGNLNKILTNVIPLIAITCFFQIIAIVALKVKKLI